MTHDSLYQKTVDTVAAFAPHAPLYDFPWWLGPALLVVVVAVVAGVVLFTSWAWRGFP